MNIILLPIFIPLISGLLALIMPKKWRSVGAAVAFIATFLNLLIAARLFKAEISFSVPWGNFGLEFALRVYHFSAFIMLASAAFGILISLYCSAFLAGKDYANRFYGFLLLSLAMVNGAVLADNLIILLLFWEAMLIPLLGMIAVGHKEAYHTAVKAFIILGITDLCLMFGTILTACAAGTLTISRIHLPINLLTGTAFIFLMIGAAAKAGAMPFHSWIPDAAVDAPLPFMAVLPAALEKLLGIYLLARISLDMFKLSTNSWLSILMMVAGGITIILAVMMALVQKDYKRLLSYHAISQVGYMILGIGTAVPAGIVGGLFHMINHSMYKSCLFLTSGSVEKQCGTTDLEKLGGLGIKMPITFGCFIIAAASISGVPPFNGFFSKELIYDGALERGWIFYFVAVLGSFFTAASFLKLGHAAFLGKSSGENKFVKESSWPMLVPMIVIAGFCVLFGVYNALPINKLIQPILPEAILDGHSFAGLPANILLVLVTLVVLAIAFLNHLLGLKINGSGFRALDHIHYAPVLSGIYAKAEKRYFDPFDIGLKLTVVVSNIGWRIDRGIDWVYNEFLVHLAYTSSDSVRKLHNGSYSRYIAWSLAGLIFMIFFAIRSG
ncbi:MAG: proton-conducting transporter membrane subunit [Candidatus Omnitrophica bacterium]|nr:proton-conducting transporter membrane subunit [Candidatus Omnitrophota bacterium]